MLRNRLAIKARVLRDGSWALVPVRTLVPGDVVQLNAGDIVPGDCLVLESRTLLVDEAALTGETYPAEKAPGVVPSDTPIGRRTNGLYLGTHVVSGTGTALVVATGRATEFGRVSARLAVSPSTSVGRTSFASPKSNTFTTSLPLVAPPTWMLSGLRSRCTIPTACAAPSASAIWRMMRTARAAGIVLPAGQLLSHSGYTLRRASKPHPPPTRPETWRNQPTGGTIGTADQDSGRWASW